MKTFVTQGTGAAQTLNNTDDDIIPVYDSLVDAEVDLSNIEEGQIIATNDAISSKDMEDAIKADLDEYAASLIQSYGQVVGSYLTMEDNSVTPQGYLLADGSVFDETKYPLLYAYLGNTNILPDIGDKLDYENAEALTYNSNTSNEAATVNQQDMTFTMTRSGLIILNMTGYEGKCGYIQVNGKVIDKMSSHGSTWLNDSAVSIPVQKGDVVKVHLGYTGNYTWYNYQTFIPYKTHKYIKAVSGIETQSTEAQEVANAVNTIKAYVSNAESYSTTEVKTNKTWIDGKPIYRKAGIYNNGGTIGTGRVLLDSTLTTSYVDTIIATGGSARGNMILNIGGYSGDNYRLCLAISDNGLIKMESDDTYTKFKWWIEYTKTTD